MCILCKEGTDDEEVWLESLWSWSFPELEREARKETARKLERKDDGVYFRASHTPDERYLRGQFQLHPEEGAVVMAAIDAHMPKGTDLREWDKASAEALVDLAKGSMGSQGTEGSMANPPNILVSAQAEALVGEGNRNGVASVGRGRLEGFVREETLRRLSCDSRLQLLLTDAYGQVKGSSRTSRSIPSHLRRAMIVRDGGICTFPGCGRDKHLEIHHILPVSQGGPTELWNLQLTCRQHHMLVHEGRWRLQGEAGPKITWVRPDGTPFEPRVRVVLDTC